jgi:hypothetical protein
MVLPITVAMELPPPAWHCGELDLWTCSEDMFPDICWPRCDELESVYCGAFSVDASPLLAAIDSASFSPFELLFDRGGLSTVQ